jgi:hypothetical protein
MNTNPSTAPRCDDVALLIDDAVEDRIDADGRATLDTHVSTCAACRGLLEDQRAISRGAAALPAHAPRPEVWARIARQIEAAAPIRPHHVWTGTRVALAMAAVMILSVVTSVVLLRQPETVQPSAAGKRAGTTTAGAPAAHVSASDTVKDVDEHLRIADANYQLAITGLEKVVAAEQASLDPAVAATLQKNLGIIDQAIRESRDAMKSQPTSLLAQTSLFDALRQKVALLEDTIALINVMRKGDQAGAAKLLGGFSKS